MLPKQLTLLTERNTPNSYYVSSAKYNKRPERNVRQYDGKYSLKNGKIHIYRK